MSRWSTRRQGEILGHLARHPVATAEDIAEHYKRDPRQVLRDLNDLEDDGEVVAIEDTRPGLLGTTFPVIQWILTDKERP